MRIVHARAIAVLVAVALNALVGWTVQADEPAAADNGTVDADFRSILAEHVRSTFERVTRYLAERPQAEDAVEAYRWAFETARAHGLEQQAVPLAEAFLAREGISEADAALARQVQSLGLAGVGQVDEALAVYQEYLQGLRFRAPAETVELATALSARAQRAGQPEAARQVYERLATAFFLNSEIRALADARLARL